MFNERISLLFKRLRVVRMVDRKRNTLVYLTYSDRVVDGSPQNSVTAVPVDRATPIPGALTCARRGGPLSDAVPSARRRPRARARAPTRAGVASATSTVKVMKAVPPPPSRTDCDRTPVTLIFSLASTSETSRSSRPIARLDADVDRIERRRPAPSPARPTRPR